MSRATWPTNRIIGVESCCAMWMPGDALVAPGPARDEADARPAGRLADRFRHHRGAAFLAADRHGDVAVVKGVEHGEIAFAGHAEDVANAVVDQLIDQHLGGRSRVLMSAHPHSPCYRLAPRRSQRR